MNYKTILRNGFYFNFKFKTEDNDAACAALDKLTFKSISFESNSLYTFTGLA